MNCSSLTIFPPLSPWSKINSLCISTYQSLIGFSSCVPNHHRHRLAENWTSIWKGLGVTVWVKVRVNLPFLLLDDATISYSSSYEKAIKVVPICNVEEKIALCQTQDGLRSWAYTIGPQLMVGLKASIFAYVMNPSKTCSDHPSDSD